MTIALMLAAAATFADLDTLDRLVTGVTGVEAGQGDGAAPPLDRRLRLRACTAAPSAAWRGPAHDTVLLQCPDAGSWKLTVPVRRAVAAQAASAAINRGDAVAIVVEGDGFSVTRAGQAMDPGPVGAWIRVRPESDGAGAAEPLRAQVVRPGLVLVPVA
jgi:flagella basal body P-ring formation protein FlgA